MGRLRFDKEKTSKAFASSYTVKNFPLVLKENAVLEIGMGKGRMLSALAFKNPNKHYYGIEKFATVVAHAVKKAESLELSNINFIIDDVKDALINIQGKADLIWLTFSDPWPKARHEKFRLTNKKFLSLYKNMIKNDGLIKLKTDNDVFFAYSKQSIIEFGCEIVEISDDFHNSPFAIDNEMTDYEQKFSQVGKKINYLAFRYKK
ncbi:tRNA (guanosine(46)-N7)-methyltransferase TrmB [Mycoplasmopsis agassizii]|uniref:tRNA (guanine-N(7)-)-methyltransferase n=1 Tax=Mycoplasmopsis agassizii TaxID=33922 RepID=A0ABX4H474_9BACT|nr:tRNA (guanosine(46)-N7)-methyltransferase TrmB [Mycoplasmopsis agassizii]PAF54694.1 tRNA (guanosine(46)-N7)-methyltransferase TrmB [Mycoplasmopsis agassizii]SMC16008.1 tRNA (guanine-N7-)-methyltransferase [Mycoplasmopsis agassizii]